MASTPTSSSRHYADAAFAVARRSGDLDTWLGVLESAARIMEQPRARSLLTSPVVPTDQKRRTVDQLLPTPLPVLRNFLHLLVDRDRLGQLPNISTAFRERVNRERGILTADVTTAVPLDPDAERVLAERLGAHLRHDPQKLVIRASVDPRIIGGVVAQVGDTLIDDSVRGRLERLRRSLAGAR